MIWALYFEQTAIFRQSLGRPKNAFLLFEPAAVPIRWRCVHCCAAAMCEECWVGGGRAKFSSHTREGQAARFGRGRSAFALPKHKKPWEAVEPGLNSFSPFQEACAVIFLSRALPAASCDSKLSLGSGVQSSELSRRSLAYPFPTEINLARPVQIRLGCQEPPPRRVVVWCRN